MSIVNDRNPNRKEGLNRERENFQFLLGLALSCRGKSVLSIQGNRKTPTRRKRATPRVTIS